MKMVKASYFLLSISDFSTKYVFIIILTGFQPTGSHLPQPLAPVPAAAPIAPRPINRGQGFQRRLG